MNKMEKDFTDVLGVQLAHFANAPTALIGYLVQTGLIPERTILRFYSVWLYKKELERTKSRLNPKGQKLLAISRVINALPISERQLFENLKSYKKWFRLS